MTREPARHLKSSTARTEDGRGWIENLDKSMLVTLRGKTGCREVEVGRGSSDATCPAVETWIRSPDLHMERYFVA